MTWLQLVFWAKKAETRELGTTAAISPGMPNFLLHSTQTVSRAKISDAASGEEEPSGDLHIGRVEAFWFPTCLEREQVMEREKKKMKSVSNYN